jgi:Uma2 family endonuclease
MVTPLQRTLTVEEYLEREKAGEVRHEYLGGYLYALAGGTGRHNRIAGNIHAHCWQLALDKPCRVYQEGMKLRLGDAFYYPDVMVVCDKAEPDPYFETEPCILVEVLSASTRDIDLREKMLGYKSLPSLQVYLVVDSDALIVRHFWRDADGRWQQQDLTGDGDIPLPCLGGTLSLPQIYRGVF